MNIGYIYLIMLIRSHHVTIYMLYIICVYNMCMYRFWVIVLMSPTCFSCILHESFAEIFFAHHDLAQAFQTDAARASLGSRDSKRKNPPMTKFEAARAAHNATKAKSFGR